MAEKSQLVELLRGFDASGSSWVWKIDRRSRVSAMLSEMANMLGQTAQSIVGRTTRQLLDPSKRGIVDVERVQDACPPWPDED